jgi:hypothetical protein
MRANASLPAFAPFEVTLLALTDTAVRHVENLRDLPDLQVREQQHLQDPRARLEARVAVKVSRDRRLASACRKLVNSSIRPPPSGAS